MTETRNKGNSLLCFPESYCVLNVMATGHNPVNDEIIEIAAIKICNAKIIDTFNTLIKPRFGSLDGNGNFIYINNDMTELTGITNSMLKAAPEFSEISKNFLEFVGNSVLVGQNVNYDINFIYDALIAKNGEIFNNDFCDLLQISRKIFPDLPDHKLNTIAAEFNVAASGERSLDKCITIFKCFEKCRIFVAENNIDLNKIKKRKRKREKIDLRQISPELTEVDNKSPFFGKYCVFTGTLDMMKRTEAAQIVVNLGGKCENNVTSKTNFLIVGNSDYFSFEKTTKQKKAEKLIEQGQDILIISEDAFYKKING